jgi:hypothetical protein
VDIEDGEDVEEWRRGMGKISVCAAEGGGQMRTGADAFTSPVRIGFVMIPWLSRVAMNSPTMRQALVDHWPDSCVLEIRDDNNSLLADINQC